jgi:hypothetical protein
MPAKEPSDAGRRDEHEYFCLNLAGGRFSTEALSAFAAFSGESVGIAFGTRFSALIWID